MSFQTLLIPRTNAADTKDKVKYPRASENVMNSIYIDGSMDVGKNDQEPIKLYKEVKSLWGKAGLHPGKLLSSVQKCQQNIAKY